MQQGEGGRVSRAEAGRVLGVHRSTVTRLVQEHPALLDDAGLVDVAELRAMIDAVRHPGLQTKARASERRDALNDTRTRTESAKAQHAELDLAERLGLTMQRADVERAIVAAGQAFVQARGQMARDLAEKLAVIDDVREMERTLGAMLDELSGKLAQALTLAAAQPGTAQSS